MADNSEQEYLEALEKLERAGNEERRSFETRASFFDKLSALAAGSIAVVVSLGAALLARNQVPLSSAHSDLSWLTVIALFLWGALISAVGHNFIFLGVAKLEADQAFISAKKACIASFCAVAGVSADRSDESLSRLGGESQELANRSKRAVVGARWLGHIAVLSFVLAYTLVFACVVRLWWLSL